MTRPLGYIVEQAIARNRRTRLVIGRERNGMPRTYRLERPPVWPLRLAHALVNLQHY
jgi:hypothetical protein